MARELFWSDRSSYEPWSVLRQLQQEMNHWFEEGTQSGEATSSFPALNLWSNNDRIIASVELPGIDPKALDVTVSGRTLTVKGTRALEQLDEGATFHRRERVAGDFVRAVELPYPVNAERVEADYSNGLVTIILPRSDADKPKKVVIGAK